MQNALILILTLSTFTCFGQFQRVDSSLDDENRSFFKVRHQETSYYENGQKELETLEDSIKTLYINMWTADGKQILKEGQGYYYEIEPPGEFTDSLLYQITDSIKQGEFKRYRLYKDNPYFLVETGKYENRKRFGKWIFNDSVLKVNRVQHFVDNEENGTREYYYANGKLKDSVKYVNGKEEGNYRHYDIDGVLLTDCFYHDGNLIGKYLEYYPSGKLKICGQYVQGEGYIKVMIKGEKKIIRKELVHNKELKEGIWISYTESGKIKSKNNYKLKNSKKSSS